MAGRSVSLTAEHDVNDAPEMVAVESPMYMAPPWCGEHHQIQARPTKGHVAHSNVRFINIIKFKDRGEAKRAEGREREQGQARKEEVRHEGVDGGLGHGRVLLVRVGGEGARAQRPNAQVGSGKASE